MFLAKQQLEEFPAWTVSVSFIRGYAACEEFKIPAEPARFAWNVQKDGGTSFACGLDSMTECVEFAAQCEGATI